MMTIPYHYGLFLICCISICLSCEEEAPQKKHSAIIEAPAEVEATDLKEPSVLDASRPVALGDTIWGYRFEVVGDFDGDGQRDTLKEYFTELSMQGEETFKYISNVDILTYQGRLEEREGFLAPDHNRMHPFWLKGDLGAAYVEVLPDLTGDGANELGVVPFNADHSNTNDYGIYSYDGRTGWGLLCNFNAHEMDLPDLPIMNGSFPKEGGGAMLSLDNSPSNQQRIAALAAYQYARLIAPKTLELKTYSPNGCENFDPVPIRVEENGSWVRVLPEHVPMNFTSYEVFVEEQPDASTGTLTDWCLIGDGFKTRVTFR